MNFGALLTPILAIVSMSYLLKVLGLGNLLKPSNALAMATGGAGKIMKTEDSVGRKMTGVAGKMGDARRNGLKKTKDDLTRGDSRKKMLARGGARALATGTGINAAGRIAGERKKTKRMDADELAAHKAQKKELKDERKSRSKELKAQDRVDSVMRGLGTAGIFLNGPAATNKANERFKAMQTGASRGEVELKRKQEAKSLAGKLDAVPKGIALREEIAATHYGALEHSLGLAMRDLPAIDPKTGEPTEFGPMTKERASIVASDAAVALGGADPSDLIVDRYAGIALAGVQKSKIPNMGSEAATLEAARQMHHYFPAEFRAVRPGESQDDWSARMRAALIIKGGIDPDTGVMVDMLEKNGYRDTAEHRVMLLDAANPKKDVPPLFDKTINISASEEGIINAMVTRSKIIEERSDYSRAIQSKQAHTEIVTPQVTEVAAGVGGALVQLAAIAAAPATGPVTYVTPAGETRSAVNRDAAASTFITNDLSELLEAFTAVNGTIAGLADNARGDGFARELTSTIEAVGDRVNTVEQQALAILDLAQNSDGPSREQGYADLTRFISSQLEDLTHTTRTVAANVDDSLAKSIKESELVMYKATSHQIPNGQSLSKGFSLPPAVD
jgi:hypothetical protein